MTELMTMTEVSENYPIPLATLRFWRHQGTGPRSAKLGRRVMYRRADIDAWIDQQFAAVGGA